MSYYYIPPSPFQNTRNPIIMSEKMPYMYTFYIFSLVYNISSFSSSEQENGHKIRIAHKYHHHPTQRALMYTFTYVHTYLKYNIHVIRTSPHPGIFSSHTTLFTQTLTLCNRLLYCFLMFSPLFSIFTLFHLAHLLLLLRFFSFLVISETK